MTLHARCRSGIALIIALVAIVVLGIVITGVFFGSSQELRTGRNLIQQERALAGSEEGLASILSTWDGSLATNLAVGSFTKRIVKLHDDVRMTTVLTRLNPSLFWAVSEATAGPNLEARRSTGSLLRLALPDLRPLGTLVVRLPENAIHTLVQGNARIDGADSTPEGWDDCPIPGLPTTGIVADGSPADSALSPFDAESWSGLASRAGIMLPGGSVVGTPERPIEPRFRNERCDASVDTNWGDPSRATVCTTYFPVIHVLGDLLMVGGAGQGTLLVEGDLDISGGAHFVGAVLVRGALRTGSGGARIVGITRVGSASARPTRLGDGAELSFSRCAVSTALGAASPLELLARSWIDVH